jgi:hypothetical protein
MMCAVLLAALAATIGTIYLCSMPLPFIVGTNITAVAAVMGGQEGIPLHWKNFLPRWRYK